MKTLRIVGMVLGGGWVVTALATMASGSTAPGGMLWVGALLAFFSWRSYAKDKENQ